jgi:adenylate cyclase
VTLRIGEWTVEPGHNELIRDGKSLHLEPKVVEVLVQLAARPGKVVTREALLDSVWPGVVVGDDVLTQAVIKLRKALGDDAQHPSYIETIPKRGYRLIAPVNGAEPPVPAASNPSRPRRGAIVAAAIGLVVAIVAGAVLIRPDMPWPLGADRKQAGSAGSVPLVAVLPLANLSADPNRTYLSDGLTADIIDALGRFSGLRVMSWNAVQQFRGKDASPQTVRSTLAARYVVQGNVRESDGTLRVSVELSDAEKGIQLWSERYDGRGAQLFEIQDRMVRSIVGALAVKLRDIEQQRSFARPTESAEAYDLVLQARALMRIEQRKPNREAKELLVRAQKLAPDYAEVWVALGENEWNRAAYGWIEDPEEGIRRAEALVRKALELSDPRAHARAYALLATLKTHSGLAEEGLAHALRALEINPSDAGSLFRQGHAQLVLGRAEEAITTIEYAMRLEPRPSQGPQFQLATAYYLAGRYRDTVSYADVLIALRPESGAIRALRAAALAQLGEMDEARKSAAEARRRNPRLYLEDAGTRFHRPEDTAKLREGLAKAGL